MRTSWLSIVIVILVASASAAQAERRGLAERAAAPDRTLTLAEVQAQVKPVSADISRCYLDAAAGTRAGGELRVQLEIHRRGRLDGVSVTAPGLPVKLARKVERLRARAGRAARVPGPPRADDGGGPVLLPAHGGAERRPADELLELARLPGSLTAVGARRQDRVARIASIEATARSSGSRRRCWRWRCSSRRASANRWTRKPSRPASPPAAAGRSPEAWRPARCPDRGRSRAASAPPARPRHGGAWWRRSGSASRSGAGTAARPRRAPPPCHRARSSEVGAAASSAASSDLAAIDRHSCSRVRARSLHPRRRLWQGTI